MIDKQSNLDLYVGKTLSSIRECDGWLVMEFDDKSLLSVKLEDEKPHTSHYWIGHKDGYLFCGVCKKRK